MEVKILDVSVKTIEELTWEQMRRLTLSVDKLERSVNVLSEVLKSQGIDYVGGY